MTVLLLILKAVAIMAVLIGFAAIITMDLYGFLKHFGYFKRIPPPQTSEQLEDYPSSDDFRMLCEQRARERGM